MPSFDTHAGRRGGASPPATPSGCRLHGKSRRGGIYIAVLGVAMIASMAGLAALQVERANLREAMGRELATEAQLVANSAVELALARMKSDPNWRVTYTHGVEHPAASWISFGSRARLKFALLDTSDNNLSNDPNDAVTIRGVGSAGDAVCVTTVSVEPGARGLNCLDAAVHAGGRVTVDNLSSVSDNVSSNHSIVVTTRAIINLLGIKIGEQTGQIDGNAWSTGGISANSSGVTGAEFANQNPAREMPDPAATFDYYLTVGTRINFNSLINGRVEGVLNPSSNPYGSANPQGIYVIDCAGQAVRINNAQIVGTLVLLSPSVESRTTGTINWQSAAANYPALLVRGALRMDHSGSISGLVYTTGNLSVTRSSTLNGIVVAGGTVTTTENLNITYNSSARDIPPPGFGAGIDMRVVPGTWRRTASN